ncbi:MAG: PIN domain-containing protein [Synergistaceae bacterium]|jgi:predicted nucleic acid-binding protein|nr:PIN domain-containing protein [Synergistaceae bacterium]
MKILLDTNVVLDKLASRKPFDENADSIFAKIARNEISGFITAAEVTDIYYLLRKKLSDYNCRVALRHLFELLQVLSVSQDDCESAIESPLEDFEDALILTCAEKANIDFVITRDEAFLKEKGTISPSEFLGSFGL